MPGPETLQNFLHERYIELLLRLSNANVLRFWLLCEISSDDWGVFLAYLDASLGGADQHARKSSALNKDVSLVSLQEDEVSIFN